MPATGDETVMLRQLDMYLSSGRIVRITIENPTGLNVSFAYVDPSGHVVSETAGTDEWWVLDGTEG